MEQFTVFLKNIGTARVVMLAVVGVIFFGIISMLTSGGGGGAMDVLYSDLEQAEAAEIVTALEQQGVSYQLDAGGAIIRVPSGDVARLRLQLAGQGLGGGVIGKEIFDRDSSFGRTTFELNVNLVRAIEGELSRTIREIRGVSDARVHIVMPERRPFQREASEPKASILIRARSGGISSRQAEAIQALVAAAVPGLSIERVAISDTSGRLLSDGRRADPTGAATLEQSQLAREEMFRARIENLLSRRVGAGSVRAEVAVNMNRSRTTTSQIEYNPESQVVLSTTTIEESSEESEGGVDTVSVSNNIPTNEGVGGTGDSSTESKTEERTNFENSKTETVTITEPGEITQIRVSVLVDGIRTLDETGLTTDYQDRGDAELQTLRELVESAIPFDATRGDVVTVQSLRFTDPEPFAPAPESFVLFGLDPQSILALIRNGGAFIVGILFLLVVVRPIVLRLLETIPEPIPPEQAQLEGAMDGAPALTGPMVVDSEVIARAAAGDEQAQEMVMQSRASGALDTANMKTDSRIDMAQVEGRIQDSVLQKVSELIKSNPEDSAQIVRSWLYAET